MKVFTERERIINKLKEKLEPLSFIYALWLEGADASGLVDEYSDLDFCLDFEDNYEQQVYEAVENSLKELAEFDFHEVLPHGHPKLRQRAYHLKGTNSYLMIDFCYQLHSRDKDDCIYIENNIVESAKVIFDKINLVQFKPFDKNEFIQSNTARYNECIYRYSQHDRVLKYVYRGNFLEAYTYYNRYVFEPLIDMIRLIYTPANDDYYLIHISHHIPIEDSQKLEYYAKISSIDEIMRKTNEAKVWFEELETSYNK